MCGEHIFTRIFPGLELDHLLAHRAVVEEEQARGGLAGWGNSEVGQRAVRKERDKQWEAIETFSQLPLRTSYLSCTTTPHAPPDKEQLFENQRGESTGQLVN